ncbi:MAG: phosphatidate cytidylyltransferase [Thermoleophilaceae bacterium]
MDSKYPRRRQPNRAGERRAATKAGRLGDLAPRILVAAPAAVAAVLIVLQGGLALALALALLAAGATLELYRLTGTGARVRLAGVVAAAALPPAALYGGVPAMMAVFLAAIPAALALARPGEPDAARSIAFTLLGVTWIGLALAHGVLLRELPDGDLLVVGVLAGTFLGDTAAHLVGAAVGRRQIAPRLSPQKTLEGLLAGIAVGTLSLWLFMTLSDAPLEGFEAALAGLAVAVAAPVGDLFESLFKRDAGVKDTGRAFGPHGGILDRIDAVAFTAVAGYYVIQAFV